MYIHREQELIIGELIRWFPVVSVTGPRQSGKSTLLKNKFSNYKYINLEDPQLRAHAQSDPVGFIRDNSSKLIIDEAQLVPELFSMVQVVCDENKQKGQYILSGSQNFLLQKRIGQSLAGRVGIARLLPLSLKELRQSGIEIDCDDFMFQGGYPQLHAEGIPRALFFQNYIDTYIRRDVVDYLDVRNKQTFSDLLQVLAQCAGSLRNISQLANTLDISFQTVKAWLSILETSYITFSLPPFHTNSTKRLTKANKIYFWDTGLLCYLLGIETKEDLLQSDKMSFVFENFAVSQYAKNHLNAGRSPMLYFYRDDSKREIDLLDCTDRKNIKAYEIKSSRTYHDKFAKHLCAVGDEIGVTNANRYVVCRVDEGYTSNGINVLPVEKLLMKQA